MDSNVISKVLSFISLANTIESNLVLTYGEMGHKNVPIYFWVFAIVYISYNANLVALLKKYIT